MALPARLGGLGIPNPVLQASSAYHNSKTFSDPLTSLIIEQTPESRLDIVADIFWGNRQGTFFDVRAFHPMALSYCQTRLDSCYRSRELEKRRCYEERIREVERGTFAPLVFTTSVGVAPATAVVAIQEVGLTDCRRSNHTT